MQIKRDVMQIIGEQISQIPEVNAYLTEHTWLKLVVGAAVSDSPLHVILCGNMLKTEFYSPQVRDFVNDFQRMLVTLIPDVIAIVGEHTQAPLKYRAWGTHVSEYDDHWDFGWSMSLWSSGVQFEPTYPSIEIKGIDDEG